VGEEEVAGGEAREWGAAEVHDHLHERRELRVVLHPSPKLPGEKLQQPPQLLVGLIRPRGGAGLALRGAQAVPTAAEGERAGPRGEEARGGAAGAGEKVGREDVEAGAERRRRRHGAAAGGTRVEGNEPSRNPQQLTCKTRGAAVHDGNSQ
jgi:hypothetical protein